MFKYILLKYEALMYRLFGYEVLLLSFSPFFTIKQFTERDEKRTKRFLIIMFMIAVFILCLAITSIVTVIDITHIPR